jgi:hypothetical protein
LDCQILAMQLCRGPLIHTSTSDIVDINEQ